MNGFDIGYAGLQERKSTSDNIPLTVGSKTELWNKVMKEVRLGRVAGPFSTIPFDNYIQSPIGLVPKAGSDQTRLIFHLSYDFKKERLHSVNFSTPQELCSVCYRDLDFAVQTYLKLADEILTDKSEDVTCELHCKYHSRHQLQSKWRQKFTKDHCRCAAKASNGPNVIFAGKTDLKSAFRILGLSRSSWKWLIMKAQDPLTNEWKFFVDKCLPFGSSISCSHFQRFSDALCHIVEFKLQTKRRVTNYLDDFLFIARTLARCNTMIRTFMDMCDDLGVPLSPEKTEWAAEWIIFLGILLDG